MLSIPQSQNLIDVINGVYGVKTRHVINPVTLTVGVAATRILNSNPRRLGFTLINLSANSLYVSPDPGVSATAGIFLAANGGTLSAIWTEDFELVAQEWWALAGGAASAIYILMTETQG